MDEARQAGRPDSRNALLYIAAASLVGSSIYFATLSHWFFSDDFHWLETAVKSVSNPRLILTHRFFNYFRPVVNALFSVNYLVFGLSAFGYHLFNVILHLISGFLVGSLAYRIFHYRTLPAVFGTLIFAVNPAGSEAVIWVSGRTDLLSMLFFLAAFNLAIWKPFGPITNRMVLYFTLLMAVFSKESAVVWPMILFCYRSRNDVLR